MMKYEFKAPEGCPTDPRERDTFGTLLLGALRPGCPESEYLHCREVILGRHDAQCRVPFPNARTCTRVTGHSGSCVSTSLHHSAWIFPKPWPPHGFINCPELHIP